MNVLAIDTATSRVSVALCNEDRVLASLAQDSGRRHAELLTPSIQQILEQSGLALADVDAVAVDVGPGGFTGMRIGLVTARALAHVAGAKVCGVCSLDLVARGRSGRVVAAIDARKDEVYSATYVDGERVVEPDVGSVEELVQRLQTEQEPALVIGDGAVRYRSAFEGLDGIELADASDCWPSAEVLGKWVASVGGEGDWVADLMYVRKAYFD